MSPGPAASLARIPISRADAQFTALILGFFGSMWFGWAQQDAPAGWFGPLLAAGVLSLAVAVLGAVGTWRWRRELTAARDRAASRRYGIIVGVSYTVLGAGAAALGATGHPDQIAPWVAFVTGVHFWALVPVLRDRRVLIPLGVVVVAASGAALALHAANGVPLSLATGVGTGTALLVAAVLELLRRRPPGSERRTG
ncbi:hypothetical protein [Plantactinospora sp. KBS50]|uniref:hypothetical protein n=1 Tax=Plantactinospora sp. KBS50 TaxID=2024580 RepID=UPI000BAAEFB1|nr:hypothetical protein [Plantactinospora sp. KBS50]ASW57048.1 hypothetical protein CIK06_27195 [Plantactinospora sp. KBS50]